MNQENSQPNEKKHNYFYKITNLINGKYYYGIRSTDKEIEKDNYWGSGTAIEYAIKKYGKENFKKEIIADYLTRKEASDHEKMVVTFELINLDECYNLKTGGDNEGVLSLSIRKQISETVKQIMNTPEMKNICSVRQTERMSDPEIRKYLSEVQTGKIISDETRAKNRISRSKQIITPESRIKAVETRRKNNKMNHTQDTKNKMGTFCVVDGIYYYSLSFAESQLGISRYKIEKYIIENYDGINNYISEIRRKRS